MGRTFVGRKMKSAVVLVLCLASVALAATEYSAAWAAYVAKYELTYSPEEYAYRETVYAANMVRAAQLEKENPFAKFGETIFSHLAHDEFASMYLNPKFDFKPFDLPAINFTAQPKPAFGNPDPVTFDWGDIGAITPVKNQGACGSCWAFSAVETMESYWALSNKPLTQLSVEQVVDCDRGDGGCNGGWPYLAYKYVIAAGGIDSEDSYPYHAGNGGSGACAFNPSNVVARFSGYSSITGEGNLYRQLSTYGPVSICVDASTWGSYQSGVMTSCGSDHPEGHCIQLTGYNNYPNGYWNVRNSWGTGWGMNGYLRIAIGRDLCGLADYGTTPSY